MTITALIAVAKQMIESGQSREDVFAFLDAKAIEDPALAPAISSVKGFLGPIFDQGNVSGSFTKAIDEVVALIKNKFGPVSDAPEIGLA